VQKDGLAHHIKVSCRHVTYNNVQSRAVVNVWPRSILQTHMF